MDRPGYTSQPPPKRTPMTQADIAKGRAASQRAHDHEVARRLPPIYGANGAGSSFAAAPSQALQKVSKLKRLHNAIGRQFRR